MKYIYFLLLLILAGHALHAQTPNDTTTKKPHVIKPVEFPGGMQGFGDYIAKRVEKREVEKLIGVVGKVKVSFVVDTMGRLVDIKTSSNIGCGCEEEIVHILSTCNLWKPATFNGRGVRQPLLIPISFNFPKETIKMAELRKANGGYLFQIKDTIYNIDNAAAILGETFPASQVEIATVYSEPEKFNIKKKDVTYLVKIRS